MAGVILIEFPRHNAQNPTPNTKGKGVGGWRITPPITKASKPSLLNSDGEVLNGYRLKYTFILRVDTQDEIGANLLIGVDDNGIFSKVDCIALYILNADLHFVGKNKLISAAYLVSTDVVENDAGRCRFLTVRTSLQGHTSLTFDNKRFGNRCIVGAKLPLGIIPGSYLKTGEFCRPVDFHVGLKCGFNGTNETAWRR